MPDVYYTATTTTTAPPWEQGNVYYKDWTTTNTATYLRAKDAEANLRAEDAEARYNIWTGLGDTRENRIAIIDEIPFGQQAYVTEKYMTKIDLDKQIKESIQKACTQMAAKLYEIFETHVHTDLTEEEFMDILLGA